MIAALYVANTGPYLGRPGVDSWDVDRDGRRYDGPHPVIAHPPCGHWGNFAWSCKQPESWRECGAIAVAQVRRWGGVLEHPSGSRLWAACGISRPGEQPDPWGFSISVPQVWWGHEVQKMTWLYIVGVRRSVVDRLVAETADRTLVPTKAMGVPYSKGRVLKCLPKSRRPRSPSRSCWSPSHRQRRRLYRYRCSRPLRHSQHEYDGHRAPM